MFQVPARPTVTSLQVASLYEIEELNAMSMLDCASTMIFMQNLAPVHLRPVFFVTEAENDDEYYYDYEEEDAEAATNLWLTGIDLED